MLNGIRCRAHPTTEQAKKLAQWIGCARLIYNAKVSEMQYFRTFSRKALGAGQAVIDQAYSQFKDAELTPFLSEVPSQILRNSAVQFMNGWQRFLKGLASPPTHKRKGERDSVHLTNELFRFVDEGLIEIGTKRFPVGTLRFTQHREITEPKSIIVSRKAGRWYVSFNFEDATLAPPRPRDEILADLSHLDEAQLTAMTWAGDRGVRDMLHGSDGQVFHLTVSAVAKNRRRELTKRRLQRRLARQQKGSRRRDKTKRRIAHISSGQAEVRRDFAHQTSRKLVDSPYQVFVFEDLKITNMTRRPKPKQDEATGEYLPNGAAAKAGLNRSILQSCWGNIVLYTHYKAERANKVTIKVHPHFSSQTCSQCGHTSSENRSGKQFSCTSCGFKADADANASAVLRARGAKHIIDGEWREQKAKKTVSFRKRGSERVPQNHVERPVALCAQISVKRGCPA
ncbi:putative transposase [Pseudomonas nitritireducens]|uniref:Putative transposase n=1 Tax=Pseudomonas nitroreducens TaxID=46680 RepID=A0A7W7KEB4_PSENT|nr:RNA-guided endonuclease TnpB family protein [Pseudomonas nitritireducens]MBB4861269.1 putative transposase [Pseudomonas nitritireducens]